MQVVRLPEVGQALVNQVLMRSLGVRATEVLESPISFQVPKSFMVVVAAAVKMA
jgi:hypothetical protein